MNYSDTPWSTLVAAQSALLPAGTTSGSVIMPPQSTQGLTRWTIVSATTSNITMIGMIVTMQFSPSDTDDVWITGPTVVPALSAAAAPVVSALASDMVMRRVRAIVTNTSFTADNAKIYMVGAP